MTSAALLPTTARSTVYELVMLVLCVYALVALAAQSAFELDPASIQILDYADLVVCAAFAFDFVRSLVRAPDRWRYLTTSGLIDLASSIPTLVVGPGQLGYLRAGRAARIIRVLRVLRGVRATRGITSLLVRHRAEDTLVAAVVAAGLLIVVSSVSILQFEQGDGSRFHGAGDALWWAFATITTVGYGDLYPETTEGRMVAAILMLAGVGLFGSISAFLASWFLSPELSDDHEIRELRREIQELRTLIEADRKRDAA